MRLVLSLLLCAVVATLVSAAPGHPKVTTGADHKNATCKSVTQCASVCKAQGGQTATGCVKKKCVCVPVTKATQATQATQQKKKTHATTARHETTEAAEGRADEEAPSMTAPEGGEGAAAAAAPPATEDAGPTLTRGADSDFGAEALPVDL